MKFAGEDRALLRNHADADLQYEVKRDAHVFTLVEQANMLA
jgi:hypothetical protein